MFASHKAGNLVIIKLSKARRTWTLLRMKSARRTLTETVEKIDKKLENY